MIVSSTIRVLGMMSGTSLDGVDLAACQFSMNQNQWNFEVLASSTHAYSPEEIQGLKNMESLNGSDLWYQHLQYGSFLGKLADEFLKKNQLQVDLIASHGHTLFHRPELGYTFQAGHGQEIAIRSGIPTVSDFRQKDISLGGQGAPLVPVGDLHLFPEYEACLNLGGFANITLKDNPILAYDICPLNFVFNPLAQKLGHAFDDKGNLALSGHVIESLLAELNQLDYYSQNAPKSLGREWVEKHVFTLLNNYSESEGDKLRTMCEHAAIQIAKNLDNASSCLVTGGGTYNYFLMQRIRSKTTCELHVPARQLIDFKEAIVFAFLGALHAFEKPNCLATVTGAKTDSIGGIYHKP